MDPYGLMQAGGRWLLVEAETGEVIDYFQNETLARQTLAEQLEGCI